MKIRSLPGYTAFALLIAAGCDRRAETAGGEDNPGADGARAPHHIDPAVHQPGGQLLGLGIERMEVLPDLTDSLGWMGQVTFSGPVTVSGEYRSHPTDPDLRLLCFYPDSASATRLPRFPNDLRYSWFCFTNQEEAQRSLGGPLSEGSATIVIDRFDYLYQHTDTYNTAELREVIEGSRGGADAAPG